MDMEILRRVGEREITDSSTGGFQHRRAFATNANRNIVLQRDDDWRIVQITIFICQCKSAIKSFAVNVRIRCVDFDRRGNAPDADTHGGEIFICRTAFPQALIVGQSKIQPFFRLREVILKDGDLRVVGGLQAGAFLFEDANVVQFGFLDALGVIAFAPALCQQRTANREDRHDHHRQGEEQAVAAARSRAQDVENRHHADTCHRQNAHQQALLRQIRHGGRIGDIDLAGFHPRKLNARRAVKIRGLRAVFVRHCGAFFSVTRVCFIYIPFSRIVL